LYVRALTLAGGTALLTYHIVEQENESGKEVTDGILSPRQSPRRGRSAGQSTVLLVGRLLICSCFVMALVGEFTMHRQGASSFQVSEFTINSM
jgi:hypothetical protein